MRKFALPGIGATLIVAALAFAGAAMAGKSGAAANRRAPTAGKAIYQAARRPRPGSRSGA